MKKKFPRVTELRNFDNYPSDQKKGWWWQCNRCFGWFDPTIAWVHSCGTLCECGHAFHAPNKCGGKTVSTWSSWVRMSCHCKAAAPEFEI